MESCWYLEGYLGDKRALRRFTVPENRALSVGRVESADLSIPERSVSSLHAEFTVEDGELRLRDLGSSNGTFVNRVRIDGQVTLTDGDAVHFCHNEFRVGRVRSAEYMEEAEHTMRTAVHVAALSGLLSGGREMAELLRDQAVVAVFQPICFFAKSEGTPCAAFEVLGRGAHPRLPSTPVELFRIAEATGSAVRLSQLFRDTGVLQARQLPGAPNIFFNTHPEELNDAGLIDGLAQLRRACPQLGLTLEIHEAVAAASSAITELRARLSDLDIGLAYDDFGAGQSRLVLISESPPDYLKFDMSLIRDIDLAPPSRQKFLHGLVQSVCDMDIVCVAEGVETEGELAVCREMGFESVQGYLLGRPAPLEHWLTDASTPAAEPASHIG